MSTVAYSAVPSEEHGNATRPAKPRYPHQDLPQFTWRAVGVGIGIGALLCFTNMYFGLQTGWISMMSLQSSLLGFAIFKPFKNYLKVPFGPAENIVLQSIAVATGTMPLAAGFVGIIPALKMMTVEDNPPTGPVVLSATQLILWCLAVAFFGVFIAVPLREQVIIREKLPFPSGTATAQMIGVLHDVPLVVQESGTSSSSHHHPRSDTSGVRRRQDRGNNLDDEETMAFQVGTPSAEDDGRVLIGGEDGEFSLDKSFLREDTWRINMMALGISFTLSGLYTVMSYFVPVIAAIPAFDWLTGGTIALGATWQWFFTPSLSYVGQGVIMGFPTTASMLLGCIVGWGILSPIATLNKWVEGPVSSSTNGARGWILWISLGVMIAEAIVSLIGVVILSLVVHRQHAARVKRFEARRRSSSSHTDRVEDEVEEDEDHDEAPADELVPLKIWVCGLILSSLLCLFLIWYLFRNHRMPLYATALALALGSLLSVLGVRALGSTDLNPVSGIGKVSQFVFAGVVPGGIVANLIAGGIAEAGAQQAGDLMQDLKTGHLMGASPKAQFWGQLIGSVASVFFSTGVYMLYSTAYDLPTPQFPVPTAKVWLDLARLVNGHPLPNHAVSFMLGFAGLFAGLTILTTVYSDAALISRPRWLSYVPSGIAFAIGMYNLPNFTLARFIGGLVSIGWDWHCKRYAGHPGAKFANIGRVFLIIIASGFVLGEGTLSIVNLLLKSAKVHSWTCAGCIEGICTCN
ncbi:OPT oligopeptide transporter protein-domain-containing protein [Mortierella sp. GBAus27b]|nr:OPT oligopeptide transporter protein-domain-containing protein [Mortierella sp. GBAus27b]